jgi:hypothetical protein
MTAPPLGKFDVASSWRMMIATATATPRRCKAPPQPRDRLQAIAPRTALIGPRRLAMDTKKARREIPPRLAGWLLDY